MGLDDEDVVQLCRIGLFQSISPRDIMFLVRVSHTVIAESGTTVVKQNTMADFFYVIVDGLLRDVQGSRQLGVARALAEQQR